MADQQSDAILAKLRTKVRSYTSYKIYFSASVEGDGSTNGTVLVSGLKFAAKAMGQELYYDGKTLWNYIPRNKEVMIEQLNPSESSVLSNPTRLLNVNPQDYNHQLLSESGGVYTIELLPKVATSDYSAIRLHVDSKTSLPVRISIDVAESWEPIELVINRIEENIPVKSEDFQFDPKSVKGIEVIDFR